ncbi:D-isomer specific 2-hydroxyacid dehydrogenase NAD-binding protein [Streptomyces albus]|uniref:D-isomer specific 2-hydroxyacid dehydrogenase NAD-binding protein n=2 Tax=Streptomyces TaxID=1883 RepID=A0A0B5ENN5_STRA4|nr:D-isomer specific 2-hydroxyacid dehydrogenase NAD-binding protein [Streptomyces albus]AOU75233.1 D-isomer specific 2-hydroxyacid dehydrogenase NAD-binding protein [Streptomyces albus]AYN31038.1 D-isomer specific 2-hydroxyacid dehydrogenase NAD-binding protein [Streptomyces albus]
MTDPAPTEAAPSEAEPTATAPPDAVRRPETLLLMNARTQHTQFGPRERDRLRAAAALGHPLAASDLAADGVRDRLAEVEVLLTSWGCPVLDEEVLRAAPRLRAVLHAAGSVRHHVSPAVFRRGLLVTTAADANADPVAHFTLGAVLWAFKKVPFLAMDARRFREDLGYREGRGELSGRDRTVVLVGFSRIGRRVTQLLRRLDLARVLVVDPVADPAEITAAGAEPVRLAEALPQADVLSLHAPSLPETHHLIGAAELAALPPGAVLVNTARGALVDTAALEDACRAGLHAILDVTDPEPLPASSPLYELPNVVLTPHIAGSLGSETRTMAAAALTELERYAAGLPPLAPVTPGAFAVQA